MFFRGKYSFLSNFFPVKIFFQGLEYPTVENAFQAAKTTDETLRRQFQNISPSEAKKLGKTLPLREDWNEVRIQTMAELLAIKFSHIELRKKLLQTCGVLVEDNYWHDNFWGRCTCDRCSSKLSENLLGKMLTALREGYSDGLRFLEGFHKHTI